MSMTKPGKLEGKTYSVGKNAGLPDSGILHSSGLSYMSTRKALQLGAKLRDEVFIQYPLLPEAIFIFQQIISSREWALGGKPDPVFKALDFLQNARAKNLVTGVIDVGFEGYLKRRALDYLLVGRTSFAINDRGGGPYLEYIDPTKLLFERKGEIKSKKGYTLPVRPKEKVWRYDGRKYSAEDMTLHHPLPIGSDLFISPVAWLIPAANLAWLIAEHNAASLDGRKLRDILMVGSPSVRDSIEQALTKLAQLYAGVDVSEVGIPIIEINNMSGTPIKDLFAMIGLSSMPESLDQQEFMFNYANQISGTVGVTLRHFWNDERNTNRALETVQESRQQQKGPAAFIRSEQRLINNSGFLERVAEGKVRFGFIEESDLASLKTKAEVLQAYGEAALNFQAVFGSSLTLQSFMSWMKRIGALPLDIELDENAEPTSDDGDNNETDSDEIAIESGGQLLTPGDTGVKGEQDVVAMEKSLNYGEVVVDQDGFIIGKRMKIFVLPSLASLISEKVKNDLKTRFDEMQDTLVKAESYIDGEDVEEVEAIVDYQLTLMASENIELLYSSQSKQDISPEDVDRINALHYKSAFNIVFAEGDIEEINVLCEKYEISVFDLEEEHEVQ